MLSPKHTIFDAIKSLDASGLQICLITANSKLLGTITDGDIRRGLLAGVSLDDSVSHVMNRNPRTAQEQEDPVAVLENSLSLSIRQVPVISSQGNLVGLLTDKDLRLSKEISNPVVLMAGGKGTRLLPLTKDVPKPMIKIGNTPIIEIILRRLKKQGFKQVYISVNYLGEQIEDHVKDGAALGLSVSYLHEESPLGTAGSLGQLRGEISEPFLVMNSDLLTDANLMEFMQFHVREQAVATIGVREYSIQVPFGVVDLEDGKVRAIREKPTFRTLVSAGIYALNSEVLGSISKNEYCDMPDLIKIIQGENFKVSAFPIHEGWLDIGQINDLNEARLSLQE